MSNTSLTTLDSSDLDSVTGGKTVKPGPGGSGGNSEVLSQLTNLQSSIKDLNKPAQSSSAFGGSNLMLFAMLAMNRPAAAQTNVVYVRRRGCW
jgi:hypothetical protein